MAAVNRSPISDEELAFIKAECDNYKFLLNTIQEDDLTSEGIKFLKNILVEGEPADGLMLRTTRYGRKWHAYKDAENYEVTTD